MAKKKYYAVVNGVVPGIYYNWDDCKKNVDGFPGAVYKSFPTLEEADAFMRGEITIEKKTPVRREKPSLEEYMKSIIESEAVCFVDGSYNTETGEYSYGLVLYHDGKIYEDSEKFFDEEMSEMRNVAGELEGSMHAMKYCLDAGIKSLDLYYDYQGIESWATGAWKANKEGTRNYKEYYETIKDKLNVHFCKVKGHSGNVGNDRADALARGAFE
jgi:ribonuclease HI